MAKLAGCGDAAAPSSPPTAPATKQAIEHIEKLSIEEVKRYHDECTAHGSIDHPKVPYRPEDCARIGSRWNMRDFGKPSAAKPAEFLPKLK